MYYSTKTPLYKSVLLFFLFCFLKNIYSVENGASIYTAGYKVAATGKISEPSLNLRNSIYYANVNLQTKSIQRTSNSYVDSLNDFLNITYIPQLKVLGANIGITGLASITYQTITCRQITPMGSITINGKHAGLGDSAIAATLGWHCKKSFHFLISAVTFIPTGIYDVNKIGNIGKNRYAFDPELGITWYFGKSMELSTLLGYTFNFENPKTHYKSGNELHIEYCLSKHFQDGLMAGLSGYWVEQLTGDSGPGATLGAFKGKLLAMGPLFAYTKKRFTLMIKYFHDFDAKNHVRGDKFFLECNLKF